MTILFFQMPLSPSSSHVDLVQISTSFDIALLKSRDADLNRNRFTVMAEYSVYIRFDNYLGDLYQIKDYNSDAIFM